MLEVRRKEKQARPRESRKTAHSHESCIRSRKCFLQFFNVAFLFFHDIVSLSNSRATRNTSFVSANWPNSTSFKEKL